MWIRDRLSERYFPETTAELNNEKHEDGSTVMKKMIIWVILLAAVGLLNCFQQIKAQMITSTVSFTVEKGTLALTSVPLGYLEANKKEQKKGLPALAAFSATEAAAQPQAASKGQNSLIINDYRGAADDRWALYTQLRADSPAVIKLASANLKIILAKEATKVVFNGQKNAGQTKSQVKAGQAKLQTAKNKQDRQLMITWTLADTASSQDQ